MPPERAEVVLIYDGECPACSAYSQRVRIEETVAALRMVNAREPSDALKKVTSEGYDMDQGMVLMVGDRRYRGADAIHALALMGSRSGLFNRLNYWAFRSKTRAAILYPILRFFRKLLLKMLGRTKINNLNAAGNEKLGPRQRQADPFRRS